LLSVSTATLTGVPAVEAATVSMTAEEFVDVTLTYRAAPGEENHVAVTMTTDFGGWLVSESGRDASGPLALTTGPGCTSLTPQIALCEHNVTEITETPFHVVVFLGDSRRISEDHVALDLAWASGVCGTAEPFQRRPCQVLVHGGRGPDNVFANDAGGGEVRGGPGGDALVAGRAGSRLIGGRGGDLLTGGAGRDTLSGGGGRDTIRGGLRSDELRGGAGMDTFYARDRYRDRVFGGEGRDRARVDRRLDHMRSIERFFSQRFCCA
jgi:RTX calcium-binding nonapeptide repeat (4 copies)